MANVEMKEIEAAVEGILFASGEPVQEDRICVALELDHPTVEKILQKLMDYYAYERRGIRLLHIEDSWQLCSSPDYADVIRKAFEIRKPAKLSQPALEVLTIIAYYQPTTRAYVDQIRGVDSSYTVGLLMERKLIETCGRLQVPGRPRLYRTTKAFLRAFHLTSLDDLPEMPDLGGEGQMRIAENGEITEMDGGVSEQGEETSTPEATEEQADSAGRAPENPDQQPLAPEDLQSAEADGEYGSVETAKAEDMVKEEIKKSDTGENAGVDLTEDPAE